MHKTIFFSPNFLTLISTLSVTFSHGEEANLMEKQTEHLITFFSR